MSLKLDDRPDELYDDGDPGWYRQTPSDDLEDQYNSPSASKDDVPSKHPHKSELPSDALEAAETMAGTPKTSKADTDEGFALGGDDQIGEGFKDDGLVKRFAVRWTRRQKAASGGALGVALTAIFLIFSIFQGPGQIVHFSQLLHNFHFINDQSLMNGRAGNLIRYRLSVDNPTSRNLGFFGNLIADRYVPVLNKAGIHMTYENRRIRYVDIDTSTQEGKEAYRTIAKQGFDPPIDSQGKVRIDLDGASARTRRRVISGMVESAKIDGVSSVIAKRLLKLRGAVSFHPLKNVVRAADESILQYRDRIQKQRKANIDAGVDTTKKSTTAKETDTNGNGKVDPPEAAASRAASSAASEANTLLSEATSSEAPLVTRVTGIKSSLAKGVGIAGFVALTCGLQQLGDTIYDIRDANITQPLIRKGMEIESIGSQVEAGQGLNATELGVYNQDLYDKTTGTSWTQAKSIQAELGQSQSGPDLPDSAKPGFDRPAFLDILDATIGKIPGGSAACGAVTSFVGGFILDGAGWALNATGPVGFLLNASTSVAEGVITSQLISGVIDWLSGQQIAADAAGALLGNEANYGARLAANDASIAHGGQALTPAQSAALKADQVDTMKSKFEHESLYARYFDLSEPNSLAAKAVFENSSLKDPTNAVASLLSSPMSIFSSLGRNIMPKASAAPMYDYGFPEFGFSLDKIDNDAYQDPYNNANLIEPRLSDLNARYKKCFSTTVDPTTFVISSGKVVRYDDIQNPANHCKDPGATFPDGTNELDRYSFYLADIVNAKSLACYNGDEESCQELGFSGPNSTTSQASNGNIYVLGDSLTVGMRDLGDLTSSLQQHGWNSTITAECGRHLASNGNNCSGQAILGGLQQIDLAADQSAVKNAGAVVVGLGTNDPGSASFKDNVHSMVTKIRTLNPAAKIYWINLFSTDSKEPVYQAMDSSLSSLATVDSFTVIDWATQAPQIHAYPANAYHPNDYGGMADFVVKQLGNAP